jgi:hypothetical protein
MAVPGQHPCRAFCPEPLALTVTIVEKVTAPPIAVMENGHKKRAPLWPAPGCPTFGCPRGFMDNRFVCAVVSFRNCPAKDGLIFQVATRKKKPRFKRLHNC